MQAIILAAGMGKRLGEMTKDDTKCMIKVGGTTLIERLLSQLDKYKLESVTIVVGYKAKRLIDFVNNLNINTPINFIENTIYDKTNNIYSLFLAKECLLNDDTLLFESDIIVEDAVIDNLLHNSYPDLAVVDKYENWMDGTVVKIDKQNRILQFIPNTQFHFEDIPQYYKTVNIYKFSQQFSKQMYVPFLEAYCKALGNNEYYEQVLRVITMLDNSTMRALPLNGEHWYEIDDTQDLDIAESIFSTNTHEKLCSRYGGYWRYPKIIDFCYLVNPFFPNERLQDELVANSRRLLTEYPSGQRVINLLAAKDFSLNEEYIATGNGAAELIEILLKQTDDKIGIIKPTFEEYPNRIETSKKVVFEPHNLDFSYSDSDIVNFFRNTDIKTLILINPDNPSGNFIRQEQIFQLLDWCLENNIKLIYDESFTDFADEHFTLLKNEILEKYRNLIVVKSISKSYGVPGLRLGIIASANTHSILRIKQALPIWNINSFAEFFLQILGKYEKTYIAAMDEFRKTRDNFIKNINTIKWLRVLPTQANYVLCELVGADSKPLSDWLLEKHNILIKDCSVKCKGKYIRLAIRNQEDNKRLIQALSKYENHN